MPQLLLSAVFIAKTGQFDAIIVISLISSLWSLTARVSSDDKLILDQEWRSIEFSYKKCPCVNHRFVLRVLVRFLEISSRVSLLTLMWINIGGLRTGIIIGIELLWLLITCIGYNGIGNMRNLMYLVRDDGINYSSDFMELMWVLFVIYRFISSYIYLIVVTIFTNVEF